MEKKNCMKLEVKINGKKSSYDYDYLTDCTNKGINVTENLDIELHKKKDIEITDIYRIVLWKTNRFPILPEDVLNSLSNITDFQTEDIGTDKWKKTTTELIKMLLNKDNVKGVELPMASTIFRFINPKAYQIIDARAYNSIYGKKIPKGNPAEVYVEYMKKVLDAFKNGYKGIKVVRFEDMDRFLYQYDIEIGHKISGKNQSK